MSIRRKCTFCNLVCQDRHNKTQCLLCYSYFHTRCLNVYGAYNRHRHLNFLCGSCLRCELPFQSLNDNDIIEITRGTIQERLRIFEIDNELDDPEDNVQPTKYYYYNELPNTFCPENEELTILHINIRSLIKNINKLEQLLVNMKETPDAICVSETRLKSHHSDDHVPYIDGYHPVTSDLRNDSKTEAGGVVIYIKDIYTYKCRKDLYMKINNCEDVWVEVKTNSRKPIIITSIYRHPKQNFLNFQDTFMKAIDNVSKSKLRYYLFGDWNINLIKYNENNNVKFYVDMLHSRNSRNLVNKPTRVTNTSATLIDHIYSNDASNPLTPGIIASDTSDHFPTFLKIKNSKENVHEIKISYIRDMKNFDDRLFVEDLQRKFENMQSNVFINHTANVNSVFNKFHQILKNTVEEHAPLRPITEQEKRKFSKPWVTKGILKSIEIRDIYYMKSKKNPIYKDKYRKQRNWVTHLIAKSHKKCNIEKISKANNKSKAMWEVINQSLRRKRKKSKVEITKIKNKQNEIVTNKQGIANTFNDFFVNVGKNMAKHLPHINNNINCSANANSMFFTNTTCCEIEELIKSLNRRKAIRSEDVATRFIQIASSVISPILTNIFNLCLDSGVYPDQLKVAQVFPIHKKGLMEICSNFRPISILSQFNKIYEKIISKRLHSFFERYNILSRDQYGFRKNMSTSYAVYDLVENIIKNKEKKNYSCALFVDLSKAFDTVNHKILLNKLEHYGVRGLPLRLIKSYLTGRKQYTMVNGVKSCELLIDIGVPQGSVLGPLLFLIYINDLPLVTDSISKLYADDTCLLISAPTLNDLQIKANSEMNRMYKWMLSNKLSLNYSKTKFMLFQRQKKSPTLNLYINDNKIEQVSCFDYLGVKIDNRLSWKDHIKHLESKLAQSCGAIARIRHITSQKCLRVLYYGHVYSYLQYAVLAWSTANKNDMKKLTSLHNRIIRLMCLHGPLHDLNFSAKELFKNLKILSTENISKFEMANFMHRVSNKRLPPSLLSHFIVTSDIHSYDTRSRINNEFRLPIRHLAQSQRWVSYAGIKLWKSIKPIEIKRLPFKAFKRLYKNELLEIH